MLPSSPIPECLPRPLDSIPCRKLGDNSCECHFNRNFHHRLPTRPEIHNLNAAAGNFRSGLLLSMCQRATQRVRLSLHEALRGGQKPFSISPCGRLVFRPFSRDASSWPKRMVFGQVERILLQRDLDGFELLAMGLAGQRVREQLSPELSEDARLVGARRRSCGIRAHDSKKPRTRCILQRGSALPASRDNIKPKNNTFERPNCVARRLPQNMTRSPN